MRVALAGRRTGTGGCVPREAAGRAHGHCECACRPRERARDGWLTYAWVLASVRVGLVNVRVGLSDGQVKVRGRAGEGWGACTLAHGHMGRESVQVGLADGCVREAGERVGTARAGVRD